MTGIVDPAPATVKIFCSYRRVDDGDLFGTVVRNLVRDLRALYKAETGQRLELFLDRDELRWGDDFEQAISRAVQDASFFMPIITANYFESEWCRKEFYGFYGKSQSLGVVELILPVVLAGAHLISASGSDSIARIVATTQYLDWSDLWQSGSDSSEWRAAITAMVRRIMDLQEAVEARLMEHLLAEQAEGVEDSRADYGRGGTVTGKSWDASANLARIDSIAALDEAADLISDTVGLLAAIDESLKPISNDSGRSRLDRARFGAEFAPKAIAVQRRAVEVFDHALDADVELRRIRSAAVASLHEGPLVELVKDVRDRALIVDAAMEALVPLTSISNRLRGPGLRAVSGPVGQLVQSMRDMALLINRWGAQ